ncbi:hypothetical protein KXD93_13935 [Mucilaginibacter sp. BJC16-A38]|uniref:hypothetical protein n=1 Tax=Mucilaginibacter phenanthrenivorans TaxID=1234842 RepID=UPI002157FF05|nr:hypothetical protein [Mucilaginibacter phenanthrenivorans]MCR8558753.1 hypothetical protein [Mucilaginibacter phenanthrenivorans]
MKAEIFSHTKLIGSVQLRVGDDSMGHLYGEFSPAKSYYNDVRDYVWRFNALTVPDFEEWFTLNLNVQLNNGYFIYAAGGITFNDSWNFPNRPIQVDIIGIDWHVIDDFFLQPVSRSFTEEPWEPISIEQKLLFEEELQKELGIYSPNISLSIFKLFNNAQAHPLADFYFAALCRRNDDILFVSRKKEIDTQFAVIHLTWKGSTEKKNFPVTTFYKDFDEFKYLKMYPDKVDWED